MRIEGMNMRRFRRGHRGLAKYAVWAALLLLVVGLATGCPDGGNGEGSGEGTGEGEGEGAGEGEGEGEGTAEGEGEGAGIPSVALAPGLNVTIEGVVIPTDLMPEVTFRATDDVGITIGLSQFVGSRDVRFVLAYLDGSGTGESLPVGQYVSYVTDDTNGQATYDHHLAEGLSQNADGSITYKFETAVPETYDDTATHQVGAQFTRTEPVTGTAYSANAVYAFRPDGGAVTETREIVTTEACNKCHTRLNVHGRRREIQYCILCHQPQSVDPDTGNTVDMPVLIHKIHRGANLPSVVAGTPYQIIGYRNSVHDYSEVHFPQNVNNCIACHTDEVDGDGNPVAPHADVWMNKPGRAACGACHDDVNFEDGTNHLAQADDSACATCHPASGTAMAIADVHILELPKLVLATTVDDISVDGAGLITFAFTASDTDGNAILDLDDIYKYRVGYLVGWPASEYTNNVGNSHVERTVTNNGAGSYTYTAAAGEEIPVGTPESFGFTFRGRSQLDLNGDAGTAYNPLYSQEVVEPGGDGFETRHPMEAPVTTFFTTDGSEAETRRQVVDDAACAACHGEPFAGHGSDRIGVGVCVFCHNPSLTSTPEDPDGLGLPTVTVNMKDMIHRIHRGSDLESGYTTGGHGGDVDFTEIHFPGRLEQCSICHGDHDISVPLSPDVLPTTVDDELGNPDSVTVVQPHRAACMSCHDSVMANFHALLSTYEEDGESCGICHGSEAQADVETVHTLGP